MKASLKCKKCKQPKEMDFEWGEKKLCGLLPGLRDKA